MKLLIPPAARTFGAALSVLFVGIAGCSDAPTTPTTVVGTPQAAQLGAPRNEPPAPAGLVTVAFGGSALTLWPYTGDDFGDKIADPINAIFTGYADPLRIRAALRRLNGDRTAFGLPPAPPFDCTWSDAPGFEQTAFATPEEWTGSAIQLQCGEYGPVRFHLRLFAQGEWTLAATHFDLLIPGTVDHRAISWEVAEQLLLVDMIRTGLLTPGSPGLSPPITPGPSFKEIEVPVYNGMPLALRALVGGPLNNVVAPFPIPNDGRARVYVLDKAEPIVSDVSTRDFTLEYNLTVPKPFCGGPSAFVRVNGPLHFQTTARVTAGGTYERVYTVRGELTIVAVNPFTGQLGPLQRAKISEHHEGSITPSGVLARSSTLQRLFAADGAPGDVLSVTLHAGTRGHDQFDRVETCGQ